MDITELHKNQRVQFRLAGKLVQGLVVGDKKRKVIIMREKNGQWEPLAIPTTLLEHVKFETAYKLFMPIYNHTMEDILKQARAGDTDLE